MVARRLWFELLRRFKLQGVAFKKLQDHRLRPRLDITHPAVVTSPADTTDLDVIELPVRSRGPRYVEAVRTGIAVPFGWTNSRLSKFWQEVVL
jgi:hypothetical protein